MRVACWGNQPRTLFWQGSRFAIASFAGPWHESGSWWDGSSWDHDLWDVVTSEAFQALRLRQDHASRAWFVVGHRRDALWQVERVGWPAGPLLAELGRDEDQTSPLQPMNPEERMIADYAGTGVTWAVIL